MSNAATAEAASNANNVEGKLGSSAATKGGSADAIADPKTSQKAEANAGGSSRWLALDLFRFVAVLLMIQGHVFFEVAGPSVRGASWYGYHGYVHGFTAPIFLFSSGLAFGITTLRKWQAHNRLGRTVYKRLERYLILIALGYLLHLPVISLDWVLGLSPERLGRVTRIDALQNIGMALLLCELLAVLVKRKRPFLFIVSLAAVSFVLLGPLMWHLDLGGWPIPVVAWLNNSTGSVFPLIPWSAFLFCGVLTARFVERRQGKPDLETEGLKLLSLPFLFACAGLILLGDRLAHSGFEPFPEHDFWKTSPYFFLIRLGGVMGLLSALCLIEWIIARRNNARVSPPEPALLPDGDNETKDKTAPCGRVVRIVQTMGQQTLVLYVAHLVLLYGGFGLPGFGRFRRSLDLVESIAVVLFFFVAMGLLAHFWSWLKRKHHRNFERARLLITGLLVLFFLFS